MVILDGIPNLEVQENKRVREMISGDLYWMKIAFDQPINLSIIVMCLRIVNESTMSMFKF